MEDTSSLNIVTIANPDEHQTLKILSDFEELNNIDLYPSQAIQCKLLLPDGMKFFQRRMRKNGVKIMYVGMLDKDW